MCLFIFVMLSYLESRETTCIYNIYIYICSMCVCVSVWRVHPAYFHFVNVMCPPAILPVRLNIPVFTRWMVCVCSLRLLSVGSRHISGMCIHSFMQRFFLWNPNSCGLNHLENRIFGHMFLGIAGGIFMNLCLARSIPSMTPACRVVFTKQWMPMSYQQKLWTNAICHKCHGAEFQSKI